MKKLILGISVLLFTASCDSSDYSIDQNEQTNSKSIENGNVINNIEASKRPGMTSYSNITLE